MTQRDPEDPEPPWGASCAWPRRNPRIDTADARKVRADPVLNEAAAHRAARRRSYRLQGMTSGGRRL